MIRRIAVGVFILLFATALVFAATQDTSRWKRYRNTEYGFEIAYPPDWLFDTSYQDNSGKPPSPGQRPAFGGETRTCLVWRWMARSANAAERACPVHQLGADGWRQRFFLPEVLLTHAFQLQVAQVSSTPSVRLRLRRSRGR
jgi:hypothetical protein